MYDHILQAHAKPDNNNLYNCNDCNFATIDKMKFGKHYKSYHGDIVRITKDKLFSPELNQLKINFDRLNNLYKKH